MPSDLDLWSEIISVLAGWQQLHAELGALYVALGKIGEAVNLVGQKVAEHEQHMQRLAVVISHKAPDEKADS